MRTRRKCRDVRDNLENDIWGNGYRIIARKVLNTKLVALTYIRKRKIAENRGTGKSYGGKKSTTIRRRRNKRGCR